MWCFIDRRGGRLPLCWQPPQGGQRSAAAPRGCSETVVVARGHFSRERLSAWWGFNLHPPAEVRYSSATQCSRTVRARTTKWKHFAGVDPRRPEHNKRWRRSYRSRAVTHSRSAISFLLEDSDVCVVVESLCNKLTVPNVSMNCIRKSKVWIVCADEEEEGEEMDAGVRIVLRN